VRVAITGGTGFVGRHLARALVGAGHHVVLIARGADQRDPDIRQLAGAVFLPVGTADPEALRQAFMGCDAVAHCAGINLERGAQTYQRVHAEGTRNVVDAAMRAGVKKIVLLSFLRARPACGSAYHESKWAAEEIVRSSGLDYTVIKAGLIYGGGDHMLDHLSLALRTLPIFAMVGMQGKPVRPTAVEDVVRILQAALVEGCLSGRTVGLVGPEEMPLREAVLRVARVLGKSPFAFRMPIALHYLLAWFLERVMPIPLISMAQVRMLAEGIADPLPGCGGLPEELRPRLCFTDAQIRRGLPETERGGIRGLLCRGCLRR
jgi:nucleoside-diphosphate-sugar epimerase